jgi:hypothetical protein
MRGVDVAALDCERDEIRRGLEKIDLFRAKRRRLCRMYSEQAPGAAGFADLYFNAVMAVATFLATNAGTQPKFPAIGQELQYGAVVDAERLGDCTHSVVEKSRQISPVHRGLTD